MSWAAVWQQKKPRRTTRVSGLAIRRFSEGGLQTLSGPATRRAKVKPKAGRDGLKHETILRSLGVGCKGRARFRRSKARVETLLVARIDEVSVRRCCAAPRQVRQSHACPRPKPTGADSPFS